ncbi:unnamed protein product, partial [Staurois parvus]
GAGTCQIQVTRSHFRSDRLGDRKWKVSSLTPCSLLGHVTGPRRLQDHSRSAALLTHAQWVASCEAASYEDAGLLESSTACET